MSSSAEARRPACDALRVEDLLVIFSRAFNSGDADAVERLYEPDAVLIPEPGVVLAGDGRRRATRELIARGVPITVAPRHAYVSGDVAMIVNDFGFDGVGRDGTEVHQSGTANDVARRGADGRWRYAISAPTVTAG